MSVVLQNISSSTLFCTQIILKQRPPMHVSKAQSSDLVSGRVCDNIHKTLWSNKVKESNQLRNSY